MIGITVKEVSRICKKYLGGGVFSKRILIVSFLLIILLCIGVSLAFWQITFTQKYDNLTSSSCMIMRPARIH